MIKKLTLLFLLFSVTLFAQPRGPHNNPNNHPACSSPNPPWWCDQNPVPIDDYLPLLLVFVIGYGIYSRMRADKLMRDT